MDYYGYRKAHGRNYNSQPKKDGEHDNGVFNKSTYNKYHSFESDSLNDLKRWIEGFRRVIEKYTEEKYLYEKEKELKVESEERRQEMKLQVSDDKGYLEDMRKGIDWYIDTFDRKPMIYKDLMKDFSIEMKRLKKLKKYLSYRVRSLAGKGMYNEPSKDILQYLRIRIDAVNILFDPKYDERTPLEDIYGIDETDDDYDLYNGENPNKLFYQYD